MTPLCGVCTQIESPHRPRRRELAAAPPTPYCIAARSAAVAPALSSSSNCAAAAAAAALELEGEPPVSSSLLLPLSLVATNNRNAIAADVATTNVPARSRQEVLQLLHDCSIVELLGRRCDPAIRAVETTSIPGKLPNVTR